MIFGPAYGRKEAEYKGKNYNNNGSYIGHRWSARYGLSHLILPQPCVYPHFTAEGTEAQRGSVIAGSHTGSK